MSCRRVKRMAKRSLNQGARMIDRRTFLGSLAAFGVASTNRAFAQARGQGQPVAEEDYFTGTVEDGGFSFRRTNMDRIAPRYRRQLVKYIHKEPPGSLVVDTKNHALYVTFENNTALRYGVGVSSPARARARRTPPIGLSRC